MQAFGFGCSFVAGTELESGAESAWPALLSQQYNLPYKCLALGGSGNLQIAESVLRQLSNRQRNFYIISWTWIDRHDYVDPLGRLTVSTPWKTLRPTDTTAESGFYYQNLHSEYQDKLQSLILAHSVLLELQQQNCPFLMTYMDPLMFDQRWNSTPATMMLQAQLAPHMTRFDQKTFLDWSRDQGHEITENWHPRESAHQAAAQILFRENLVNMGDERYTHANHSRTAGSNHTR